MGNPKLSQGPTLVEEHGKEEAFVKCQRRHLEVGRLKASLVIAESELEAAKSEFLSELGGHQAKLSRRQHDVHALVNLRLSNKEIAAKLHISERTVKFHITHILSKFGVRNRAELWTITG